MFSALIHYWRANVAVAAAAATATAVLCGALIVGDSVRNSLADLALERLGGIDYALAGQRFFSEDLGSRLDQSAADIDAAALIALEGSVRHGTTRSRASGVGIQGIDSAFLQLYERDGSSTITRESLFGDQKSSIFPPAAINASLAESLGAQVGDDILISLQRWSEVPSGSVLGRKETAEIVETVRLSIHSILPDRGLGSFSLRAHQSTVANVFVPLAELQAALDQAGLANTIVASGGPGAEHLDDRLRQLLSASDIGLTIQTSELVTAVESDEFILRPSLGEHILDVARRLGAQSLAVYTYLATSLSIDDQEVPYSTITALTIDAETAASFGHLTTTSGSQVDAIGNDEIVLNRWTAEQLGASVGDAVDLQYYVVEDNEELAEAETTLRVSAIVEMSGLGGDRELSQEYPGIADNDDMASWDPPFPIDLDRISPDDETYWDDYRATPKAFLALPAGQELWRNRWGQLTTIRLANLGVDDLWSELVSELELAEFGYTFRAVKASGLEASRGATDFGGLFIGFSQFLIVSAALLVGLLFGLAVEQRIREIGLRLALGFPARRVSRLFLIEGGLIAAIGTAIGLGGAVAYAAAMMAALGSWWKPAVGTSRLELEVTAGSLLLGGAISLIVVYFAIWRTARKILAGSPRQLLSGSTSHAELQKGRVALILACAALGLAGCSLLFAILTGRTADPMLFYLIGPSSLLGFLALFSVALQRNQPRPTSLLGLARANAARNRGRSQLAVSLVAFASFLVVVVAAYREDFGSQTFGKDSGTGGFDLIAESDIPLPKDLHSQTAEESLGLSPQTAAALGDRELVALRLLPGEDTSCLNLYQPTKPRLLSVPTEMVERGGFGFKATIEETSNPWTLLEQELEEGVIPAIGDFNSTQWILKLPLGGELPMATETGEKIQLRLVASLDTSIFQSELLISQAHFERYFPSRSGTQVFLFGRRNANDGMAAGSESFVETLESDLEPYGFDVVRTPEKLARFHTVQNTYLSTFRVLGGLGLLLGTIGLAIVMVRNTLERRGELAALRAFGFRRSVLRRLVVYEYALLLVTGLGVGTAAALLTVGAHVLHQFDAIPWTSIGGTLSAILIVGLIAGTVAATLVVKSHLVAALKAEL